MKYICENCDKSFNNKIDFINHENLCLFNIDKLNINSTPSFIEVCAGCGGLSTGLIKSGLNPILLNDIDLDCCNTLKKIIKM
jgi:16S rRNA A1518/A1519 N6-dimethyltransferase RsmA/KsgA/DIM1 with predicted DNA glycosylase/AP lyase activity